VNCKGTCDRDVMEEAVPLLGGQGGEMKNECERLSRQLKQCLVHGCIHKEEEETEWGSVNCRQRFKLILLQLTLVMQEATYRPGRKEVSQSNEMKVAKVMRKPWQ
jgi:hypothetical protein